MRLFGTQERVTPSRASEIRGLLGDVARLEREWQSARTGAEEAPYLPWMPANPADFLTLAIEATAESAGDRFLEIGAGIGTKMLLAQTVLGLDCLGLERVPAYAARARELGLAVQLGDAAGYDGYGEQDILYLNRPFRDVPAEHRLERRVRESMASGAVLIGMNMMSAMPPSWLIVDEDVDRPGRGVWIKP